MPARPTRHASELIRLVLQARRKAQATINRIYGARWHAPSVRSSGEIIGLNKQWRELELKKKLTDNLSLTNLDMIERAYDLHWDYADLVVQFHREPRQRDDGGTRLTRLFWDSVGSYLQIRFGRWFDDDVAILTEIAFDLPVHSVEPKHIADARARRR
jgi:hypothetical protein